LNLETEIDAENNRNIYTKQKPLAARLFQMLERLSDIKNVKVTWSSRSTWLCH